MPTAIIDEARGGVFVIPTQHASHLRAILDGEQAPPVPLDRVIQQVFSSDYARVYSVPAPRIVRLPAKGKATQLALCRYYEPDADNRCTVGDRCKFVHADVRGLAGHLIHHNYAWTDIAAVTYERFEANSSSKTLLAVAAPGSKKIVDLIPIERTLKTNALVNPRRPLSHCAHYYFNRTCNLGPDCQFIHAVFIDPNAKPHQRAPAPTQLGRGDTSAQPITQTSDASASVDEHEGPGPPGLSCASSTPSIYSTPGFANSSASPDMADLVTATPTTGQPAPLVRCQHHQDDRVLPTPPVTASRPGVRATRQRGSVRDGEARSSQAGRAAPQIGDITSDTPSLRSPAAASTTTASTANSTGTPEGRAFRHEPYRAQPVSVSGNCPRPSGE